MPHLLIVKILSKAGHSGYVQSVSNFNTPEYCALSVSRCLPNIILVENSKHSIWYGEKNEKNEMGTYAGEESLIEKG